MGFLLNLDTNLWIAIERGKISAADIHAITSAKDFPAARRLLAVRAGSLSLRLPQWRRSAEQINFDAVEIALAELEQ